MKYLKYCIFLLLISCATVKGNMSRKEMKAKAQYFDAVQYNRSTKGQLEKKVKKQMDKSRKRKVRENVIKPRKGDV